MHSPALPESLLQVPVTHRALHAIEEGRVENSTAAIQAAIEHGYGIEIDVQLSSDAQAMVFHDETLDRLTDQTGPVNTRTAAALGAIALNQGRGDTIPTLSQIISLVAGRVPLLIEIKDQHGDMGETDGRLEASVAQAIETYAGDVAVMSFNPHSVALMARLAPNRARGIISSSYAAEDWPELSQETRDRLRDIPDYDRVGASFISHQASDLARPRVAELKAQGAKILCWTIRSTAQEQMARQIADNVTFERYLSVKGKA